MTRHSGGALVEALSGALESRNRAGLCTEAVLLRPLEDGPVPANELWRRGRVSKRAMKSIVKSAEKRGLVAFDGGDVRLLAPLPPAEPASCPPLEALVSQLELEHPHFPVPYGGADPTFTGGPGVDWKPVARDPASTVDGLPMTALLSQALVAFAIEYEEAGRGPIQWAANILHYAGDDGEGFPPLAPRGTHSVRNLERLGIVTVDPDKVVRPTKVGQVMRDAWAPLCEQIEARWRSRLGSPVIDEIIDAVRVEGDWRPFPLVVGTGAEFALLPRSS